RIHARKCPACDVVKTQKSDPFCESCLERLPTELKAGACNRSLYIATYHQAVEWLQKNAVKTKSKSNAY
ncbi:MAG: hypothetical protein ACJ72Z_10150, partial [Pyrinomonadaceae bacterium]